MWGHELLIMNTITKETLGAFLHRFYDLSDSVLRRLEHQYLPSGLRRTTVTISVQDREADIGWSNLVLTIDKVVEVTFRERRRVSNQVLSDGLRVSYFEDVLFLDFSPASDVLTLEDIRASDFYVAGSVCSWLVQPYSEE